MLKKKILFVCLGNICRSPAAEEVMRSFVEKEGLSSLFYIDSAGLTSFHRGEMPDRRMRDHASKRGYSLTHLSRPLIIEDFYNFDMIFGMDKQNMKSLYKMAPETSVENKIYRLTDFCVKYKADDIPDPYYGGPEGFDYVMDLLEDVCNGLISYLKNDLLS